MDLSKLSDSELDALEKGDLSKLSDEALDHLSVQAQPKDPQIAVAEKLAPGFASFTKGLVETGSGGLIDVPNKDNLPESPVAEFGGRVAAVAPAAIPVLGGLKGLLGELAGPLRKGAANALEKGPKKSLIDLLRGGSEAPSVPSQAIPEASAGIPGRPGPTSISDVLGAPKSSGWDFPIRKRGTGVE